ncbi:HPF/RaiA family ribosome-associated protein [Marinibaculum pumilum]|uniref:HPF/RaiA family ribosome-associated protein n=1 Tax=Marinibaculum pumilum TaxID=1766165 RepID=A0ABV7L176_9PROT
MQVPLEIAFHNLEKSEALEQKVRDRVAKLHRFHDRIVSCRVAIEVPHRSRAHALGYHVRIEVRVPEKELVVSHDPGPQEDHFKPGLAVRDAFDAMERQLEEYGRRRRGVVKSLNRPLQGRVVRLFADHGFIAATDGREIYFHRNSVVGTDFDNLSEEATVELEVMEGESPAGPQASTVKAIPPMRLDPGQMDPGRMEPGSPG